MSRTIALGGVLAVVGLPLALLGAATSAPATAALGFDPAALAGEIPDTMLDAYLSAAARWDVDWALLAGIGKVECDHARAPLAGCDRPGTVNPAGARGPMQFLGNTWRADADRHAADVAGPPVASRAGYATDGDGDGTADPWVPADATHAAARYLRDLDVQTDPWEAVRRYTAGPSSPTTVGAGYADRVTGLADHYRTLAGWAGPGTTGPVPVPVGGWALPFHPAGLVTRGRERGQDPLTLLTKPHHSGRVAADIPLPVGTPIRALHAGTVIIARTAGDCGTTLIITIDATADATAGAHVTYCHLTGVTVKVGDQVTAGQTIGTSGGQPSTPGAGSSTGPHLHLHITTNVGRRCPQPLLAALWTATAPPTLEQLPTAGCTHDARPDGTPSLLPPPPVAGIRAGGGP